MKRVPTSVMVISIIGIILGALGVLGLCMNIVLMFVKMGPNPVLDMFANDTLYKVMMGFSVAIGVPLAILEIVASISSIQLRPWARKGMIVFAWASLAQIVLGMLFNVVHVFPKMFQAMQAAAGPGVREGMIGGIVGGVCGLILTPIFPICILYFFRRPHVVDAFNGIFPAEPTAFPMQPDVPPGQFP